MFCTSKISHKGGQAPCVRALAAAHLLTSLNSHLGPSASDGFDADLGKKYSKVLNAS